MKNRMLLILMVVGLFALTGNAANVKEYQIVPQPQQISYSDGCLKLKKSISVAFPSPLSSEANMLKQYLEQDFGLRVDLKRAKKSGDIILKLDESLGDKDGRYVLATDRNIQISAASSDGVFSGIQSLRQMILPDGEGQLSVQKGVINDFPAFGWRSFMLDEGRNFKGEKEVKHLLDEMARLKMNVFQWHLTDDQGWRLEIKKYPKLTEIGAYRDSTEIGGWYSNKFDTNPHYGFYTQEKAKEIIAYAKERHITIVPEIEMPGHASAAIASYTWLGSIGKPIKTLCSFGTELDIYNVADPKVIQFLDDVIAEVAALFPGPVIHIGGDEVHFSMWEQSPSICNYVKSHGLNSMAELQVEFTNNMSNYVVGKGKRMMGWNDITGSKLHDYNEDVADASNTRRLADGTIVQFWKGDIGLIKETAQKGYDIVNSNNVLTYLDYGYDNISLSKAYSFNPIPDDLPANLHNKILGCGCQLWTEWVNTPEKMNYQVFPRIAAYAECGWTLPQNKDFDRFKISLDNLLQIWKEKGISVGPVEDVAKQ
ncbi:beta-N-acetylhexosaminidase [Parabacteroides bouchesdurhonensis]|uniref:beta-N-acetylhexosaminidase n=1 Tax=Parabacteroides bouchesdurhonensis TaxID=1936995 RepID=UPI000E48583E|nr:beta-N-acetylhexosaminidase [Parabacteroides bouchesdurhonensis]RHJ88886.1 glycoside hydrolase family 20 [Bacteroides sp. AM07-16]